MYMKGNSSDLNVRLKTITVLGSGKFVRIKFLAKSFLTGSLLLGSAALSQ